MALGVNAIVGNLMLKTNEWRKSIKQSVKDLNDGINEMGKGSKNANPLKDVSNNMEKSSKEIKKQVRDINKEIDDEFKKANKGIGEMVDDVFTDLGPGHKEWSEGVEKALKETEEVVKDSTKKINKMGESILDNVKPPKIADNINKETEKVEKEFKEMANSVEKEVKEMSNSVEKELKDIGKTAENATKEMENINTNQGGGLAGAISTAAITGGLTLLAQTALSSGDAMSTLKARTGATGEELEALKGNVDNLFNKGLSSDKNEIAIALTNVKTQTGLAGEELEKTTMKSMIFAKKFDVDVNEINRSVSSLMKNMGATSDQAFDVLTTAMQTSGDGAGELLDSFWEFPQFFKTLGFSLDEMNALMAQGAKNGVYNMAFIVDSFKEMSLTMTDGSAKDSIQELGLNYEQLKAQIDAGGESAQQASITIMKSLGNVQKESDFMRLRTGIYGAVGEDMNRAFFQDISKNGLQEVDSKGSSDQLAKDNMEGFSTQLTAMKNMVSETLLPLGTEVLKIMVSLRPVIEPVTKALKTLFEMPGVGKAIVIIGMLVGGILGLVTILGPVITGFQSLIAIAPALGTAFTVATGPVGLIVAAIVALGAILYKMYKSNFLGFGDYVRDIFGAFKDAFENIKSVAKQFNKDWIKEGPTKAFENLGETIKKNLPKIFDFVMKYIVKFSGPLGYLASLFWDNKDSVLSSIDDLKNGISTKWELIKSAFVNAFNYIKTTIGSFVQTFVDFHIKLLNKMVEIKNTIVAKFWDIINGIRSFISKSNKAGIDFINSLVDGIKSLAYKPIEAVTSIVENMKSIVADGVNWIDGMLNTNFSSMISSGDSSETYSSTTNNFGGNTNYVDASSLSQNELMQMLGDGTQTYKNQYQY